MFQKIGLRITSPSHEETDTGESKEAGKEAKEEAWISYLGVPINWVYRPQHVMILQARATPKKRLLIVGIPHMFARHEAIFPRIICS